MYDYSDMFLEMILYNPNKVLELSLASKNFLNKFTKWVNTEKGQEIFYKALKKNLSKNSYNFAKKYNIPITFKEALIYYIDYKISDKLLENIINKNMDKITHVFFDKTNMLITDYYINNNEISFSGINLNEDDYEKHGLIIDSISFRPFDDKLIIQDVNKFIKFFNI
jgi:hypothetical protein